MQEIQNKTIIKDILKEFSDRLFDRYYITNPPLLKMRNNVSIGYRRKSVNIDENNTHTQSIDVEFSAIQPTEEDIKALINVFVETLKDI